MSGESEYREEAAWRAVRRGLGPEADHVALTLFQTVDSTNGYLKRLARAWGEAHPEGAVRLGDEAPQDGTPFLPPALALADCQTAGRGRLGRTFVSPPGTGLYMSLLLPPLGEQDSGAVTMLAAVAVCEALEESAGVSPKIKWVNDVFLRGRKVCGILAEGLREGVVVGVGVNLLPPPGGFPPEAGIAGAVDAPGLDRWALGGGIARRMLEGWRVLGSADLLERYRARMPLVGRDVCFTRNGQQKNARVTGVARDGGLMVVTEQGAEILRSGEVTLGSGQWEALGL